MIIQLINIIVKTLGYTLIFYVFTATIYIVGIPCFAYFAKTPLKKRTSKKHRFCIMIPAHNEEKVIALLLDSVNEIDYPKEMIDVLVIADNCSDRTIDICRSYNHNLAIRKNEKKQGKGYAIEYGIRNINMNRHDAVLLVDADNVVDCQILNVLNSFIDNNSKVIQCFNGLKNRSDSWFTELLYVSRTMVNILYHASKYKLGLSSYLMGNGMCFSTELLNNMKWNAFSIGEDWEYYAYLIEQGFIVDFAVNAKVFHIESTTLKQATSQRLRWSKGRFSILKSTGFKLLVKGMKSLDIIKIDGALPLVFPNYSLLFNLSIVALVLNNMVFDGNMKNINNIIIISSVVGQISLFAAGAYLCGQWYKIFVAVCRVPIFLFWKLCLDLLSISGIYKGDKWIRTKRK